MNRLILKRICLLSACLFLCVELQADTTLNDVKKNAANAGSSVSSKFNSKTKIKSNALNPMQGQGNVSSVDNTSSFSAPIQCFEKYVGAEISYIVSPASFSVSIKQDTNLDKILDYSTSFSSIIGVCQNGFVTGNWSAPQYKKIIMQNSKISTMAVDKKDVFACFCTSSSCDYSFDANVHNVLDGAINAVLVASNINISGDRGVWDDISSKSTIYFNYKTTCGGGAIGSNNSDPRSYYATQSSPDLSGYLGTEAKKSDSLYSAAKTHAQTTIPMSGNNMAINYKALNDCYTQATPIEKDGNIILNKVDSCEPYKASCTLRTTMVCDQNGANCEQLFFNGTSSSQTKSFCYSSTLLSQPFNICDKPSQGIVMTSSQINKSFSSEHLYAKYTYDCGTTSSNANLTQSNNLNTDGKGSFKYSNGANGVISGLPSKDSNSCPQKYCTVQQTSKDSDVHSDNSTDNSSKNLMDIKICTELISGTFSCPLESGEVLIDDCNCKIPSTMTNRAIGELKAVEEMINDFSCSTL